MDCTRSPINIPDEAYLFFPKGNDVKIGEETKILRRIFEGNTKYDKFEYDQLEAFEKYLQSKQIEFPSTWKRSNSLRFLIATRFKYDNTIKSIQEYLTFRQTKFPLTLTTVAEKYLNSGILYVHGRDNKYRPIIILNSFMLDSKKIDIDVFLDSVTYQLEYLIENIFLPGQIENWIFLHNLGNMGLTSLPLGILKRVMGYFQNNFRGRLYKMYVLNVPLSLNLIWNAVKGFIEETTLTKISFHKTSFCPEMLVHINKDQLEKKYGGNRDDLTDGFWPPNFPSNNYLLSTDNRDEILVNKEIYVKMYKENQLEGHVIDKKLIDEECSPSIKVVESSMETIDQLTTRKFYIKKKKLGSE